MIASMQSRQAAYLASLFMLSICTGVAKAQDQAKDQSAEPNLVWYYHETLTTPADSRAILKPYRHPEFRQQHLGNQAALKQWAWLKQHKFHRHEVQTHQAYRIPQSQQKTALPFWPVLMPK